MNHLKHGDIVLIQLNQNIAVKPEESERLALVISANAINDNLPTVIICPLIEAKNVSESRIGATYVPKEIGGLSEDRIVLSFQIQTISKERIVKRISSLPSPFMRQVKESLQTALNLD